LLNRLFGLLTGQVSKQDRVFIVVYAGASAIVLATTQGVQKAKVIKVLSSLTMGGTTNGTARIEPVYNMAQQAFSKDGVNRVSLPTDGDFNVVIKHKQLIEFIKHQRQKGITLTTLSFGLGNYNDHLMEQLADAGNDNYAYTYHIHEARKVLVNQMNAHFKSLLKMSKFKRSLILIGWLSIVCWVTKIVS
jgi:Ca-activated chloride channel family protein